MNIWPDIVVGLWLLYAAWEDWRERMIDLGVPVAIVLTRVAVEGPWFLFSAIPSLALFYLFLLLLERYHELVTKFGLPGPRDPIWYDGDTYLLMGVSIYLGLTSVQALAFMLASLISTAIFYIVFNVGSGKRIAEVLNEPMPFSPGVLITFAILLHLRVL